MIEYECAICSYKSNSRSEFVEFKDTVKLKKVIEKAKVKGRSISNVEYICLKCSNELYQEEIRQPRSTKVTCPRCGEVIEIWF